MSTQDLSALFGAALQAISDSQQSLNQLDGYNGNHGDNMAQNLDLIVQALQSHKAKAPAKALQSAARTLQTRGAGGSSRYYAEGLRRAATELGDRSAIDAEDVVALVQTLLSAVPDPGRTPRPDREAQDNVLGTVLGSASKPGLDVGDLVGAGLAFLRARQSGSDSTTAILRAAQGALSGGDPLTLGSSRAAAGGILARSILQALTSGR